MTEVSVYSGKVKQALRERLAEIANAVFPDAVWIEPTPSAMRIDKSELLIEKSADWLQSLAFVTDPDVLLDLDEARLFWNNGCLHLVSEGTGFRYCYFHESDGEPAFNPAELLDHKGEPAGPVPTGKVVDETYLQSDWDRYGFEGRDSNQKRRIVKYTQNNRLVFWTMES